MIISDEFIHSIYQEIPNASHLDFARRIEEAVVVILANELVTLVDKSKQQEGTQDGAS